MHMASPRDNTVITPPDFTNITPRHIGHTTERKPLHKRKEAVADKRPRHQKNNWYCLQTEAIQALLSTGPKKGLSTVGNDPVKRKN